MDTPTYAIYGLFAPDGTPRYVGSTQHPIQRSATWRRYWPEFTFSVLAYPAASVYREAEASWIRMFRASGYELRNRHTPHGPRQPLVARRKRRSRRMLDTPQRIVPLKSVKPNPRAR